MRDSQKGINMQRFFADPSQVNEEAGVITLTGGDVNHIKNVLRMRSGDEIWVSAGGEKEYYCAIDDLSGESVILRIYYVSRPDYELPAQIYLFQGLPKGDKMELIVQKAVELGAFSIIPVEMKRCVVRLDAKKAEKKRQRWQQIAEGGAKQSRRMIVPEVAPVMSFRQALEAAAQLDICLLPYENAKGMEKTREILKEIHPGMRVGIFIGPEGGFEEEEVQAATEMGARQITLGHRILRTETAGMALLSVLMFQLEEK